MLAEFAALEERNPAGFQRVTQVIAHLMRHQFAHVQDRGSQVLLEALNRPEFARLVEGYFDVAGYRLVHRETEGWAGILPDPERVSLPKLRIDESIVLLVMRRIWEEALQQGEIQDHGTARTTLNEAYAVYEAVISGTRRTALGIGEFRAIVKALQSRAILRLEAYDAEAQDMDLDIRALIATVAGDDFVAALEHLLSGAETQPVEETETEA